MIEFHAITPHGRELVAQVVDGKLILPPENAPQTQELAEIAGQGSKPITHVCGA